MATLIYLITCIRIRALGRTTQRTCTELSVASNYHRHWASGRFGNGRSRSSGGGANEKHARPKPNRREYYRCRGDNKHCSSCARRTGWLHAQRG